MQLSKRFVSTTAAVSAALALAACGTAPMGGNTYPPGSTQPYPAAGTYSQYGQVTNVEYVRGNQSSGVAGAVIGGAVGGLAGSQVGGGSGRTAATVAGVVGGALIGRAIEQRNSQPGQDYYRVTVRLDNGTVRSFDYADAPNVRIGDRVRADGNQLYR